MSRCGRCPVPFGEPCRAEADRTRSYLCDFAADGGPVQVAHILGTSRRPRVEAPPAPAPDGLFARIAACPHHRPGDCACGLDRCLLLGRKVAQAECRACLGL